MSVAFTFPGQGSQAVGMGSALAEAYPAARAVFDEVDEALGQSLSTLMFEGDADELTRTANAQPALMAVSMAATRALEAEGVDVERDARFVAGHSLGEYSALAAAGTFGVGEAARLLRTRGEAMQRAVPEGEGAMAAIIGLDEAEVERLCANATENVGPCQVANDNGGGQIVISGDKGAVEWATTLAGESGAKRALPLPVSAPFHSALMAPAAEAMREALADAPMPDPVVLLVANVTAVPEGEGARIRDLLAAQVTGRVRWRESVEAMVDRGVDTVVEIGAGKVLTGLARRIDRSLTGMTCGTPDEVRAVAAKLRGDEA